MLESAAALVQGQLGGHGEGVADLGLAAPASLRRGQKGAQLCFARAGFFPGFLPPFAEHLGDAARGHAAAEDGVGVDPRVDDERLPIVKGARDREVPGGLS